MARRTEMFAKGLWGALERRARCGDIVRLFGIGVRIVRSQIPSRAHGGCLPATTFPLAKQPPAPASGASLSFGSLGPTSLPYAQSSANIFLLPSHSLFSMYLRGPIYFRLDLGA